MNRCKSISFIHKRFAILFVATLFLANTSAWAQMTLRTFPPTAQAGVLQVMAPPEVMLNGQPDRLSPGAQIRDTNNMMAVSGMLIGRQFVVAYVREPMGMIHRVWVLNDAEIAQFQAAQGITGLSTTPQN